MKQYKTAAVLWTIGSAGFFISLLLYVLVYQPASGSDAVKTDQILSQWTLVSYIWRAETISAILIGISTWYFSLAKKNLFWILVSFAHIIMTTMYAYLLGAYPTAAEFYAEAPFLFPLVNNTAIWIFSLSNLLFLIGMAGVYYLDRLLKRWLALTGTVISVLGLVGMTALFLELVSFGQIVAVGPLVTLLYLLNAYLGIEMLRQRDENLEA